MRNEKTVYVKDFVKICGEKYPYDLALEWDNVGLILGNPDKKVEKVYLTLDLCEPTIDEAIEYGADLIITHHPFIFSGLSTITSDDYKGSQALRLIKNDIAVISNHTNSDRAEEGLNVYLAKTIGLKSAGTAPGAEFLRVGELDDETTIGEYADRVKESLNLSYLLATASRDDDKLRPVKRVAVFTGKSDIDEIVKCKDEFDVLVTGELGYHDELMLSDLGVVAFECGHYGSEYIYADMVKEMLEVHPSLEDSNVDFKVSTVSADPYRIML